MFEIDKARILCCGLIVSLVLSPVAFFLIMSIFDSRSDYVSIGDPTLCQKSKSLLNNEPKTSGQPGACLLSAFGSSGVGEGQFSGPVGIAINNSGTILVGDANNKRILVFSSSHDFLFEFDVVMEDWENIKGVGVNSSGHMFVTVNDEIQVYSPAGEFQFLFGGYGSAIGLFNSPRDIVVNGSDNILVADTSNYRVQVFSPAGAPLYTFNTGPSNSEPWGIDVNASGSIAVADSFLKKVRIFSSSGEIQFEITDLSQPKDVAFLDSGEIAVIDGPTVIKIYSSSGEYCFTIDGIANAMYLATTINRKIYVTDIASCSVQVFQMGKTPDPPILSTISPNPAVVGDISLDWTDCEGASSYSVYRHTQKITSTSGLTPVTTVTSSQWTDLGQPGFLNGTFYYAITANNCTGSSILSNCQSVVLTPPDFGLPEGFPAPDVSGRFPLTHGTNLIVIPDVVGTNSIQFQSTSKFGSNISIGVWAENPTNKDPRLTKFDGAYVGFFFSVVSDNGSDLEFPLNITLPLPTNFDTTPYELESLSNEGVAEFLRLVTFSGGKWQIVKDTSITYNKETGLAVVSLPHLSLFAIGQTRPDLWYESTWFVVLLVVIAVTLGIVSIFIIKKRRKLKEEIGFVSDLEQEFQEWENIKDGKADRGKKELSASSEPQELPETSEPSAQPLDTIKSPPANTSSPVGSETRFCRHCGKEIKKNARFCEFCGADQTLTS